MGLKAQILWVAIASLSDDLGWITSYPGPEAGMLSGTEVSDHGVYVERAKP